MVVCAHKAQVHARVAGEGKVVEDEKEIPVCHVDVLEWQLPKVRPLRLQPHGLEGGIARLGVPNHTGEGHGGCQGEGGYEPGQE